MEFGQLLQLGCVSGRVGKWGWKDTLEGLECQATVEPGCTFESERNAVFTSQSSFSALESFLQPVPEGYGSKPLVLFRAPICPLGSADNINMQIKRSLITSRRECLEGSILCFNTCGLWLSPVNEGAVPGGWNSVEVTSCLVAMGTRLSQMIRWVGRCKGIMHF